ncbi:MAG: TraR/DksA family transcriptional regulator [Bacteriovoracaceae bacterium]
MNPEFIEEMREKLMSQRDILIERVSKISADKRRQNNPLSADSGERAVEVENDEVIDALSEVERKELAEIDHALGKIQNGVYGICEVSGDSIEEKRLRAVPYARTCIKHAQ